MSALARYFNAKNVIVSGYDKTETALTKQLTAEGIKVHYEDNIEFIDTDAQLIVYTPAVPKDHAELNYYLAHNYTVVKRSDVLGAITGSSFNICVAGTHGKTTTSAMVAHILQHSGYGCNAFLGGIAVNYNSNFWPSEKNAMDADHLDIYGTAENVEQAFIDFSAKIKPGGCLILKHGLKRNNDFTVHDTCTYSVDDDKANIHISNLKIADGVYEFDVVNNYWTIENVVLNMGGLHNIENMIAAIGVAKYLKIEDDKIKAAVSSFKGVKRRFEYIVKNDKVVYIDDYAHHPDELKALITGAKSLFPDRQIAIAFQPHLYSRTKDFADGFAEALSLADEVYLLPIYPARELPIEGVTSEMILNKMEGSFGFLYKTKEELLDWIEYAYFSYGRNDFLITAGAGDIDTLVEPIKKILTKIKQ
jgi:UDP-N-acetylmuramate--alanine ligase